MFLPISYDEPFAMFLPHIEGYFRLWLQAIIDSRTQSFPRPPAHWTITTNMRQEEKDYPEKYSIEGVRYMLFGVDDRNPVVCSFSAVVNGLNVLD